MSASMCKVCEAMLSELCKYHIQKNRGMVPANPPRTHHASAIDFLMAVAWGCYICTTVEEHRLWERTPLMYFDRSDKDIFLMYIFDETDAPEFPTLLIWSPSSFEGPKHNSLSVVFDGTLVEKDQVLDQSGLFNLESESTGDRRVTDRAAWWLSNCLRSHPDCEHNCDPKYYPPRLLQLTADTCTIVDTSQVELTGPYATLSYCWGQIPKHLTLTSRNYETLSKGFQTSQLSKTFQDAIEVVLHFGIQLLWIDCLCILQSSSKGHREDWQRHIVEMKKIYSSCRINIAANFGKNASDGCFSVRNVRSIKPCIVDIPQVDTTITPGLDHESQSPLISSTTKSILLLPRNLYQTLSKTHLLSRGWVHQERLLSPRVLHLGEKQLFWECSKYTACETLPQGVPGNSFSRWFPFSILGKNRLKWRSIVMTFSLASFSYRKDKVAAISGVAERMAQELQEVYVAGFFKTELLATLSWGVADSTSSLLRIMEPYRAPTWSWASVDGPVYIPMYPELDVHPGHILLARVDEIILDLVDKTNPYGLLKGGSLTITAPTIHISPLVESMESTSYDANIKVTLCGTSHDLDHDFISVLFDESLLQQGKENAIYLCLLTHKGRYRGELEQKFSEVYWLHGIILVPADRFEQPSAWARIGMFRVRYDYSQTGSFLKNCVESTFTII